MSGAPPPNNDIAELVALLGEDNVRMLIQTFLREYPKLIGQLEAGDRKTRHRVAHSLKSNARVVGARALSQKMADYENRLSSETEPDLDAADLALIKFDFETTARTLRLFAES